MTEYKPLNEEPCAALRWLASECVLNKTAAACGIDALIAAMPKATLADWDEEQMLLFREVYENKLMQAVITGLAPDGLKVDNAGFWPTYVGEKAAGAITATAPAWD